ncbi:uncharacterized protein LOC111711951 isoform X2 [Eurytemora carolleeae]|uniref:uncharacterized protein LOC111711951 isoform X2 n=1 Tax=Eurytemora carolleeae TaxID=1294199 RepID=UPI000C7617F7|nr:uncharacterized protein LOC111711951 isoform X2 [Eurytemora carolleeae]|eukprot:XP_023342208.1 uncharacterized protein LOC111711951 isoform X2 [Eurytemora affinis]
MVVSKLVKMRPNARLGFGWLKDLLSLGESRSYIFEAREISLAFWNEKRAISPPKFRSNIHCAASLNFESPYNAFLYREDGTCEVAVVNNLTPTTSPLVKVQFRATTQVDGIKIGPFGLCPTTHPYPFLGGKSCCQKNLESSYLGVTTGTRGLLTINSTSCSFGAVSCTDGWVCLKNPIIGNSLQVSDIDMVPASYRDFGSGNPDYCQQICEAEAECQAWVWKYKVFPPGMYCWLVRDEPRFSAGADTAGFKSSYINVPFA